jgi:integrase
MHDQEIRVRGWLAAGVPAEVWEQRPCHAFRRGFVTGIRAEGAEWHAVEYLVGHKLPGMQQPYVDAWKALKLVEAVKNVPAIGE